jgi:hypothetical protein
MTIQSETYGLTRAATIPNYPDSVEAQFAINTRGEAIVAQGLPPLAELVRQGGSWQIISAATAALAAFPTTVAGHTLFNGELAAVTTAKAYVIDSFGCVEIVTDATQQNSLALFAAMEAGQFTTPTDAGLTKASLSGRNAGGTNSRTVAGATVAGLWTPHGPSAPGATAFAGAIWRVHEFDARGLYVVRPGGAFSIVAAKSVATASQIRYFIRWHEVLLSVA